MEILILLHTFNLSLGGILISVKLKGLLLSIIQRGGEEGGGGGIECVRCWELGVHPFLRLVINKYKHTNLVPLRQEKM